jgi:hypothetical protein
MFLVMSAFCCRCQSGFHQLRLYRHGILQMLALNYYETIWCRYMGWMRTVSSTVPSEEVVKSVIQQEYYHNFRTFRTDAIYRIIMSKSRQPYEDILPLDT